MILSKKKKILEKAKKYLKNGLFTDGYVLLKEKRFSFLFLSRTSLLKGEYFFYRGAFLFYTGEIKKSIIYLKKSLLFPKIEKSENLFILIYSLLKFYKNKKVIYYFHKIIERAFNPFFIFFSYYEIISRDIQTNINIKSLEDFLPESNNLLFDKLTYALFYMIEKKYNKAFHLLNSFNKSYNTIYYYNIIYIKILYNLKKYDLIIEYFENNISYLGSIDFLYIYSASLYKKGYYEECKKTIYELIYLKKESIREIVNLGKISIINKNYIKAINYFKKALRKSVYSKNQILFLITISYQRIGLLNDSIKYFERISENNKYFHKALFNLSLLSFDLGDFEKSIEYIKKVDKKYISDKLYNKWKSKIINKDSGLIIKKNKIKYLIYLFPWLIILFSLIIFILYLIYTFIISK